MELKIIIRSIIGFGIYILTLFFLLFISSGSVKGFFLPNFPLVLSIMVMVTAPIFILLNGVINMVLNKEKGKKIITFFSALLYALVLSGILFYIIMALLNRPGMQHYL